jgi:hypothetical protein
MSQIYDALKRAEDERNATGDPPPSAFVGTPSWAKDLVAQLNELGVAIGRVEASLTSLHMNSVKIELSYSERLDTVTAAINKKLDTIQARALLGEFERGAATTTGKRQRRSRAGRGKR